MTNRIGTNQFQHRYKGLRTKTWLSVVYLLILIGIVSYMGIVTRPVHIISPLPITPNVYAEEDNTPIAGSSTQQNIIDEIKKVFGKDSNRAFKLLQCENGKLNPDAVNTNTDGSKDFSVFQVNNRWQGVQGKFLLNWKVNILIAKQIFDESHSFKMWTCGQKLGI